MARKSILIADEDPGLAPVLALHLRNEYYTVTGAVDAAAALALLSAPPPPDLVMLSVTLPGTAPADLDVCRRRCEKEAIPVLYLADERRSRKVQRFLEDLDVQATVRRKPFAT